jgi:hypothetical protein
MLAQVELPPIRHNCCHISDVMERDDLGIAAPGQNNTFCGKGAVRFSRLAAVNADVQNIRFGAAPLHSPQRSREGRAMVKVWIG